MKQFIVAFLFFLGAGTGLASETLIFSERDSMSFYDMSVILPHVKTEIVTENGRELVVHTRAAQTSDHLASFVCIEKQFSGQRLSVQCSLTLDSTIQPSPNNRLQAGPAGMLRATISETIDLSSFGSIFRNAGACRPGVQSSLYAADEKRRILYPNGTQALVSLISVTCLGNRGSLTQLAITLLPRES